MMLEPRVFSGPIKEPISVNQAKLACKCDHDADDQLFPIWIEAARDYVETQAGITMHEKTLEIAYDEWPDCDYIELPRATPLISITSLTYTDEAGVATVWGASNYIADTQPTIGRLVLADGISWPSTTLYPSGLLIRYKAGTATASPEVDVAAKMQYPVLLLVAAMFENRVAEQIIDRKAVNSISLRYGVDTWINRLRVESHTH